MERFLYRLSKSPHAARFVLKGALMLRVWDAPMARPTKDIDLLGRLENSLENGSTVVREVCALEVEPDGLVFRPATVKSERISEDADYEGVRIRFDGLLARARIAMQLDVGIGDVMVPGPVEIAYPTLLDFPAPRLKGYPRETVVLWPEHPAGHAAEQISSQINVRCCGHPLQTQQHQQDDRTGSVRSEAAHQTRRLDASNRRRDTGPEILPYRRIAECG
jgi:hypothetical protein